MIDATIAVLEGDGIGPEIMGPTLAILEKAAAAHGARLRLEPLPAGAAHYVKTGEALPAATVDGCRAADAILLAAMGMPDIRYKDGTEIVPQIDLRIILDLYAGVRPVTVIAPRFSPLRAADDHPIDFVLVRESTEGLFFSMGQGEVIGDEEVRETLSITRARTERLFDFSFALAESRAARRGAGDQREPRVTCVDKANVFRAFAFMRKVAAERAAMKPGVAFDCAYVDAMALKMAQNPWAWDVLVTENMFGDILSDLGAGLMGGLGMAPSADIGDAHAVFQPCHGSAPDIAGQGVANPTAMILSGAMLLEWLGERRGEPGLIAAGADVEAAVRAAYADPRLHPREFGGAHGLADIAQAIETQLIDRLAGGAGARAAEAVA